MTKNDQIVRRKLYVYAIVIFAVAYSLYCFVISPAYVAVENDIAYSGTVVADLLKHFGNLISLFAVSSFYAVVTYGLHKFCLQNFKGCILIFTLATVYKYASNLLVAWWREGSVPSEWLLDVIFFVVIYCIIELVPFAVILALINHFTKRHRENERILAKTGKTSEIYPFRKLYDRSNPLLCSAMACAITEFVVRFITKAASDIMTVVEVTNVFLMILEYLSILVFAVLCYTVMLLAFGVLNKQLNKAD